MLKKSYFKITNNNLIKKIERRKVISMDLNIWIHLVDGKNQTTQNIKKYLLDMVDKGLVFCPISAPLIWELYKQNFDSALRIGKLMQSLSLNITYKSSNEIIEKEIEKSILSFLNKKNITLSNQDLFTPVTGYLSSYYDISFASHYSKDEIVYINKSLIHKINDMTLTDFIRINKVRFPTYFKSNKLAYLEKNRKRWSFTKGDKEKMRRVEEEYIAKNIIMPLLNKIRSNLPIPLQLKFFNYIKSLPKDKYGGSLGALLKNMPIIDCLIYIMAISGYDITRKDNMNDFFDREIMITSLAYSDIFVSEDKWIRHLLTNVSDIAQKNHVTYLSKLSVFEEYLKNIQCPKAGQDNTSAPYYLNRGACNSV